MSNTKQTIKASNKYDNNKAGREPGYEKNLTTQREEERSALKEGGKKEWKGLKSKRRKRKEKNKESKNLWPDCALITKLSKCLQRQSKFLPPRE